MRSNSSARTTMIALTVAAASIPAAYAASADVAKYPVKPVRLIAPFVPGAGTERLLHERVHVLDVEVERHR